MARQLLYTMKEAAEALFGEGYNEASRKRLRRWIKSGVLNAVMDGSRYYIPKSEIEKYGEQSWQNENRGQMNNGPHNLKG
jgi:excisionase family DNA binding protein